MKHTFSRARRLRASTRAAVAVTATALFLAGCTGEPTPRRYSQIAVKGGDVSLLQGTPTADIAWTLPDGWTVQPEGDPLRLVGFWAADPEDSAAVAAARAGQPDPRAVDVSIVKLAGAAGGLRANVVRWLGQVGVSETFADEAIAAATPITTASGQTGIVVDFTPLLSGDLTQTQSIIGAILEAGEHTVFVKAMGPRTRLTRIKPALVAFTRNLTIDGDDAEAGTGAPGAKEYP